MSTQIVRFPPVVTSFSVTATNPSVGTDGTTAPTSATEVGFVDNSGLLQAWKGTSQASGPNVAVTSTVLPTNAAQETGGNLATIATAQGAGGTGISQPTGGSGLLGWLSGIYKALINTLTVSVSNFPATQAVTQSGTWTVQPGNTANTTAWLVTGAGGTFPVTGTFWQATQPVSAASLPLPTGAATAANQATEISSLATIATNSGKSPVNVTPSFATASISGATTLTAPANCVGFVLQASDGNSDNLNFCLGATASSTNGIQLEAGRDTGFIPCGSNVSICPKSGSQTYSIQWIAQ